MSIFIIVNAQFFWFLEFDIVNKYLEKKNHVDFINVPGYSTVYLKVLTLDIHFIKVS